MSHSKVFRQILKIIIIAFISGLIFNFFNPNGRSMFTGDNICSRAQDTVVKKTSEITLENLKNDPYDTTAKPKRIEKDPRLNKYGFIDPQKISLELSKIFFEKNALFFDARPKESYDSAHIKGALSFPYNDFMKHSKEERIEIMRKFNKDGIIICYCSGGNCEVSIDLAYEIAKLGFTSVNIYQGGYPEWEKAGFPVEKGMK